MTPLLDISIHCVKNGMSYYKEARWPLYVIAVVDLILVVIVTVILVLEFN